MQNDKGLCMILQTDNRLNKQINQNGCYFMSLLFLANKHTGYKLSTTVISKLYMDLQERKFMDSNCYIQDPAGILKHLGLKAAYNQRHDPPKYRCDKDEIEILCLQYSTNNHFVVGDGHGNIAYNPMGKTAPNYYLKSKRIFKI